MVRPTLDHHVYATPDLETTVHDLAHRLGVRPSVGGQHPALGLDLPVRKAETAALVAILEGPAGRVALR